MTWTYKVTEAGNLSVYDHEGNHVTTRMNDGGGISLPGDVLEIIGDELDARGWDVTDRYVQETMKTALVEDIESR